MKQLCVRKALNRTIIHNLTFSAYARVNGTKLTRQDIIYRRGDTEQAATLHVLSKRFVCNVQFKYILELGSRISM